MSTATTSSLPKSPPRAEIISIGSELTSGKNLDSNSQWLSVELAKIGVPVRFHTTVGDNLDENIQVLRCAISRSDLVVITGGLGPTQDDLTREAIAAVAGVDLEFHSLSFEAIRSMFAQRKRAMPERNRVQAMFPHGSEPIPNVCGTAPGIWISVRNDETATAALLVAMPGVPSEMYRMFAEQVRPRIIQSFNLRRVIVHRKINVFGAGESDVESRLLDLTQRGREPEVGITVHDATISLRIVCAGETEQEALERIEPTAQSIYERLHSLVFSEGDVELQQVVAAALIAQRLTLATAEGCTGGMVSQRLTEIPGASRWYRGGVVAYGHPANHGWLDIPAPLAQTHGMVSAAAAEALASACRVRFGSDLAVSTVGIAGPDGATQEKPVGTLWVGLATPDTLSSRLFRVWGDRSTIQSRGAKHALNQVRLWLLGRMKDEG